MDLGNGNLIDNRGTYTRTDGRTGVVGDLQLGLEHFYRDYSGAKEQVTVTDAAAALPHLTGSGAVRDLRESRQPVARLIGGCSGVDAWHHPRHHAHRVGSACRPLGRHFDHAQHRAALGDFRSGAPYCLLPWCRARCRDRPGEEAVQAWIQQQHARLGPIIAILEKFNGSSLVSERNGQVSTGGETFTWNRVIHPDGHSEDVMSILLQPEQINSLMSAYASLKESAYAGLVLGTRLSDYLSGLTLTYSNDAFGWDASALEAKLDHTWQRNKTQALQDVMDLYRYGSNAVAASGWKPFDALRHMIDRAAATPDGRQALAAAEITLVSGSAEGSAAADLMFGDTGANILRGGAGDDVLSGGDGDDTLYGGDGNDILHGDAGNDTLYGGGGNDLLLGGAGDDVLDGGEGSNRLDGGAGNDVLKVSYWSADNVLNGGTGDDTLYGSGYADTYIFNKGDGHDTIIEQGGTDKLVFGEGIAAADVRLLRQGQDVVLDLGNGHDSIRLKDWLTAEGRRNYSADIEQIVFADGTLWTPETLSSMGLTTLGTSGNDILKGTDVRDSLLGGDGDDTLYGGGGNDLLLGGAGDDVLDGGEGSNRLEGGAGNDVLKVSYWSADNVLNGGTGDDTLYGSGYADTYIFNKGDGHDTIIEQGGTDKLVFGEGIAAADVRLLRQGQDVVLDLGNGHDSIRLKDWLTAEGRRNYSADIEQIVFADGTLWTPETLSSMGLTTLGTSGNDTLKGWQGKDILLGGAGDDVLDGGEGSNRLEGGAGNDVLKVSYWSADNVLNGGTGDDTLYGSGYADTYIFNKGDGHDTIIEQGGTDKLVFGEGLHQKDARFTKSGNDLSILLNGGVDQVTVAGWFSAAAHQVESLVFQDGTVLSGEVERLIAAMALSPAVTTMQASVRDTKELHRLVASSIV